MTLTCITSQLERSAGTKGVESCKLSGKAKLAKPIVSKETGVETAIGVEIEMETDWRDRGRQKTWIGRNIDGVV